MVNLILRYNMITIYEIYPQCENRQLSKIAHLEYDISSINGVIPNTGTVIWYRIVRCGIDCCVIKSVMYVCDTADMQCQRDLTNYSSPEVFFYNFSLKFPSNLLVGNGDEDCCHRPISRQRINMGHSGSDAPTPRSSF